MGEIGWSLAPPNMGLGKVKTGKFLRTMARVSDFLGQHVWPWMAFLHGFLAVYFVVFFN